MCTVTWRLEADGYDLFANRDELRSRGRARPPQLFEASGVRYAAPIDPDGGGTWIAVNERGLGLTLLNDYAAPGGAAGDRFYESRGLLVLSLAAEPAVDAVAERLDRLDLERYRPFRLLALAPGVPVSIHHWNGRRLAQEDAGMPPLLSSSSMDTAGAGRARRELLERVAGPRPDVERLTAFHRSHEPERGPLSPCMHRPEARTVSFTHLSVDAQGAVLDYHDGPPCTPAPGGDSRVALPLVRRLPTASA